MFIQNAIRQILIISGGFLCYMMADGCTFSLGILYTKFLNVFHQSKASTAILPGLIYAIPQLSAPVICPLIDTIGSQYGAIIGGIILSISFFVSRFVVTLQLMYVTLGFCASIGLEMTYVSGIMAVTKGFVDKKYLGLALGVTVSGSGVGVLIFNPLVNYLINEFNWPGTMMIESALFLNIIVAGCFFRLASKILIVPDTKCPAAIKEIPSIKIEMVPYLQNDHLAMRKISQSHSVEAIDTFKEHYRGASNIRIYSKESLLPDGDLTESVFRAKTHSRTCGLLQRPICAQNSASSLDRRTNVGEGFRVQLPVDEHVASFVRRLSLYNSNNIGTGSLKKEISNNGSQHMISSVPNLASNLKETPTAINSNAKSIDDIDLTSKNSDVSLSPFKKFLNKLKRSLMSLLSEKVWTNPNSLLFYLSTFLFSVSAVVVWTFTFSHSINMDVSENIAALLVSVVGIGSCLGQIFFGYLSDFVPSIILYMVGCIISGLVTVLLIHITSYTWLVILHTMFGFSQGVNYALFSVILVHYSSIDIYHASLAIYLLFSGTGNLVGTSLAGYLNDLTGDYVVAYILNGILLIFSGIIVTPLVWAWHKYDNGTT